MRCFIDIENFFLKKEILNENPEVIVIYDVYNEEEINAILKEAKKGKLTHMYEIYEDYLDDHEVKESYINQEYEGTNFTSRDFQTLSQSLHFGREGKLYFPELQSLENSLIESKLLKYQLLSKQEGGKTTSNLQVINI